MHMESAERVTYSGYMDQLCQAERPIVRDCSVTHRYYGPISYPLILLFEKVTLYIRQIFKN